MKELPANLIIIHWEGKDIPKEFKDISMIKKWDIEDLFGRPIERNNGHMMWSHGKMSNIGKYGINLDDLEIQDLNVALEIFEILVKLKHTFKMSQYQEHEYVRRADLIIFAKPNNQLIETLTNYPGAVVPTYLYKGQLAHMIDRNNYFTETAKKLSPNDDFTLIEKELDEIEQSLQECLAMEREHDVSNEGYPGMGEVLDKVSPHLLNIRNDISKIRKRLWLQKNLIAVFSEVGELTHDIPWKWWGRGIQETDEEHAAEEIIDVMHFLFNLLEGLGFDSDSIYEKYIWKNDINWERWKKKIGWGEKNP